MFSMRKDWKYTAYLLIAVSIYLSLKLLSPRDIDWTITLHPDDKNPFGMYALNEVIDKLFFHHKIHHNNYTLYELYDTLHKPVNFFSVSTSFGPGAEDTQALLKNIGLGGSAFISAQYFSGLFADTLSLSTSDYFFENIYHNIDRSDSSALQFVNPTLEPKQFYFPRKNIHNYFSDFDSTATVVTVNDLQLPVLIKIKFGKGELYLNATPLAFTNVYLLDKDNYGFAELSLSHLPEQETYWSSYYHLGRMEARTPLRYILSTEPLRWAYYVTVLSLLLFIVFEVKRKQRIIPIIKPLANTSLEFISTIGNLYYQSGDHKNIAEKRIQFLSEQLRTRYGINLQHRDEKTAGALAHKTGQKEETVYQLLHIIQIVQSKTRITAEELKALNQKIDSFKY
jgi:hypothetical protein